MIKRVLVGLVGGDHTSAVLDAALEIAQRHDAKITGVTAFMDKLRRVGPVPLGAGHAAEQLRGHRVELTKRGILECIAQFEERCRSAGIRFSVKILD